MDRDEENSQSYHWINNLVTFVTEPISRWPPKLVNLKNNKNGKNLQVVGFTDIELQFDVVVT